MRPRDLVGSSHSEHKEFREVFKKMGTQWMRSQGLRTPLTRGSSQATESHSREGAGTYQGHSQSTQRL